MADCVHHWLLGEHGKEVPAQCKLCGAQRVFQPPTMDLATFNPHTGEVRILSREYREHLFNGY